MRIDLDAGTHDLLKRLAQREGRTQRAVMRRVLQEAWNEADPAPILGVEAQLAAFVEKGQAAQIAVDEVVARVSHAERKSRRDTNRTMVSTADEPAERVTSPVTPERFGEAFEAAGHAEEAGPPVVPTSKPMTSIRDVAAMIRQAQGQPQSEVTETSAEPDDDLRPKLLVRCKNGLCGHEQGKHREGTGPCVLMGCPCARFRL